MHDCRKTLPLTFCYIQSNQFLLCMQLQSEYYLHESIVMQLLTREHFFRIVKYLPCIFKANARWRARWTTTLLKKNIASKFPVCLVSTLRIIINVMETKKSCQEVDNIVDEHCGI